MGPTNYKWVYVAAFLVGSLLFVRIACASDILPNIPMPTMGGKQFWSDTFYQKGWRIQKNALTNHFRLLDGNGVRQAWGSYEHCKKSFDGLRDKQSSKDHLVILVHGILRSGGSFTAIKDDLKTAGYEVVTISYASTRLTLEEHADNLDLLLNRLEGFKQVSFVTHSMGGLVVRETLSRDSNWRARIELGRIVMIAPPNQGSAIANTMKDHLSFQLLYGVSGQQLITAHAATMPNIDGEFGIIAGGTSDDRGFNPWIEGDDDGVLSVAETHLDGARDFLVIKALHSTLLGRSETSKSVRGFLERGQFTFE